jgi:dihydropteroate synthase
VDHAMQLVAAGADIIDIGGESSRPGAEPVSEQEELRRVLPVIQALRPLTAALISIDTFKAKVADAALKMGADIINDITGLTGDPQMLDVAASTDAGLVVMHMQGRPRSMQQAPVYDDVVMEVEAFFHARLQALRERGIQLDRVALDPGIGFGKRLEHNLALLRATARFAKLGHPVLIGASRKSMFGQVMGSKAMQDRHWPGVALTCYTREQGAVIHRVHDVRAHAHALRMTEAIQFGLAATS